MYYIYCTSYSAYMYIVYIHVLYCTCVYMHIHIHVQCTCIYMYALYYHGIKITHLKYNNFDQSLTFKHLINVVFRKTDSCSC